MGSTIYTNYTLFIHIFSTQCTVCRPNVVPILCIVHTCGTGPMYIQYTRVLIQWLGAGAPLESLQPFQGYNLPHLPWLKGVKTFSPTTGSHSYLSTGPREAGCLSSGGWAGRLEGTPTNQPLPLPFTLFRITSIIKYYLQFTLLNKCFLFYLA